jgi:hypothetical protein
LTAELNEIRELRRDIQDLVVGVDSIGFQLERLVAIERTVATRELGDDPLSQYFEILTHETDPDGSFQPFPAPSGAKPGVDLVRVKHDARGTVCDFWYHDALDGRLVSLNAPVAACLPSRDI